MKQLKLLILSFFPLILLAQSSNSIESINSNEISIIEAAPTGKRWVGLVSSGCILYDPTTKTSTMFSKANSSLKSDSLRAIDFRVISGVLHSFMATNKGVAYLHAGVWDTVPNLPDSKINDIAVGKGNKIFFATEDSGVVEYDTMLKLTKVYKKEYFPSMSSNRILKLHRKNLNCNDLYCATDKGMIKIDELNNVTLINNLIAGVKSDTIQAIYANTDCASNYYLGTDKGFSDCSGLTCTGFNKANGLPSNDVTAVEKDSLGTVWIGTRDSGVAFYSGGTFTRLTSKDGLVSDRITSINCVSSTCECWVGTEDKGISIVGCDKKVKVKVNLGVSTPSYNKIAVSTYPQPASEQINFVLPENMASVNVKLYSITGDIAKEVSVSNADKFTIQVGDLPEGMYAYFLEGNHATIATGRVLVVR